MFLTAPISILIFPEQLTNDISIDFTERFVDKSADSKKNWHIIAHSLEKEEDQLAGKLQKGLIKI
jgi:hypothetical protein